jgi:hypothetical protein
MTAGQRLKDDISQLPVGLLLGTRAFPSGNNHCTEIYVREHRGVRGLRDWISMARDALLAMTLRHLSCTLSRLGTISPGTAIAHAYQCSMSIQVE